MVHSHAWEHGLPLVGGLSSVTPGPLHRVALVALGCGDWLLEESVHESKVEATVCFHLYI